MARRYSTTTKLKRLVSISHVVAMSKNISGFDLTVIMPDKKRYNFFDETLPKVINKASKDFKNKQQ